MKAHQLDADGVIINTIVVDDLGVLPGLVNAEIGGDIGDSVIDGKMVPKMQSVAPVVPEAVPMLNAELVLIGAGYWDDVQAFVAARGPYALAFLTRAQTMRRDNVLVNAWATARNITEAQLDGLFIAAGNLKVDEFHG